MRTRMVALPHPLISQNTIAWAARDSTWARCEPSFDDPILVLVIAVFLVPEHTIRICITRLHSSVPVPCVSSGLTSHLHLHLEQHLDIGSHLAALEAESWTGLAR
jgi:hypothetical protein